MTLAPDCPDHDIEMERMDGRSLPDYAEWFRPLGWVCPADPGHTNATRRSVAPGGES